MATVTGTIEAVSHKFGKFGINVDGQWYNTKQEWAPNPEPSKGDTVSFDDGGKNFIKKLKVVGGAPSGGVKTSSFGKPNIGIEVGHASNLAMRMMEQYLSHEALDGSWVGSEEYYKMFTENTLTIYRLMQGIRKNVESGEGTKAHMKADLEPSTKESDDVF